MPAPIYLPSLSHPLTIQAHRTAGTLNLWPESSSNCPASPMVGSGRPLPNLDAPCIFCFQPSILRPPLPTHISPAFTSGQELSEIRMASHLCQKPISPWSSTTWGCSSRSAISPLHYSLPVAEIWKFSCHSHPSHLSPAEYLLPAQIVSPKDKPAPLYCIFWVWGGGQMVPQCCL